MTDPRPAKTIHDFPGLFYHQVSNPALLAEIDHLRQVYLETAQLVLRSCPQNRYGSLAMTALEESLRCAIAALVITDNQAKRVPPGWEPQ